MATIRTSIQVNDMLSQQFRVMNMAISAVINSFEHLQHESGDAIDVSSLQAAQRELQQVEAQFNQVEQEIRQAETAQKRFNNSISDGHSEMSQMMGIAAGLGGAYAAYAGAGQLIQTSDAIASTEARLESLNDKLQTTKKLQDMIFQSAQLTRSSYIDTASAIAKVGSTAGDVFNSNKELIDFMTLTNKLFTGEGANTTEVNSAMLQMTQSLANGVVQWEELGAMADTSAKIVQNLAGYLGISQGELKKLASESKITSEMLKNSMFWAADAINKKFEQMPMTWAQSWTVFKNSAVKAFEPVTQKLSDIANNKTFKQFMLSAVGAMIFFANILSWVLDISWDVFNFMYNSWGSIAPVIFGIGGAIMAVIILISILKSATMAYAVVQAIVAATNPFILTVAVIIVLIGLFYAVINAINVWTGTSISATGIIAGAFMVLAAYIYNRIAFLWNIFAAIAEFFVNVWQHPMYSVKKLFYNLASNVLDQAIAMTKGWDGFATSFVNAIIDAVNWAIKAWNKFIDLLPEGVASKVGLDVGTEISHRKSITSDLQNIKGALGNWVGEAPTDYWEAPKMEMKSLGAAWNTGYNWGNDLFNFDKLGADLFKFDKYSNNDNNAIKNAILDGNAANKDTAGNTKKLADSADMLEEDLKYLRDAAAAESINKFTTAEITVDARSKNTINSGLDIDGIVHELVVKTEEAMETIAEGV